MEAETEMMLLQVMGYQGLLVATRNRGSGMERSLPKTLWGSAVHLSPYFVLLSSRKMRQSIYFLSYHICGNHKTD